MDSTNQPEHAPYSGAFSAGILRAFLRDHGETLLPAISSYVRRFHAEGNQPRSDVAREILSEIAIHALAAPERFDPTHRPAAWLLGIARNLVRHRGRALHKLEENEALISDIADDDHDESAIDLFDRLAYRASHLDTKNQVTQALTEVLARATPEERDLLTRIDLEGWRYAALAQQMGISEMTLRKRHYRIIQRLHQLAGHEGGQSK